MPPALASYKGYGEQLPFFSSTSWKGWLNSFVFMNIMERRKTGIFSICVFNNLKNSSLNFYPFFFAAMVTEESFKSFDFSDIDFCKILAIHANPFCFWYILESHRLFFLPGSIISS